MAAARREILGTAALGLANHRVLSIRIRRRNSLELERRENSRGRPPQSYLIVEQVNPPRTMSGLWIGTDIRSLSNYGKRFGKFSK